MGGSCPGGFWLEGFCPGGFWLGGFCQGGFCPGGFCPGGFCPRTKSTTNIVLRSTRKVKMKKDFTSKTRVYNSPLYRGLKGTKRQNSGQMSKIIKTVKTIEIQ